LPFPFFTHYTARITVEVLILHYLIAFRVDRPLKIALGYTSFSPDSKRQETNKSIALFIELY
jgi:hypothetical protein